MDLLLTSAFLALHCRGGDDGSCSSTYYCTHVRYFAVVVVSKQFGGEKVVLILRPNRVLFLSHHHLLPVSSPPKGSDKPRIDASVSKRSRDAAAREILLLRTLYTYPEHTSYHPIAGASQAATKQF